MTYQAVIETRQNGRTVKENSPAYDNQLQAECWLESSVREAKELKVKVTDHFLTCNK
jgi:hypothetical protein